MKMSAAALLLALGSTAFAAPVEVKIGFAGPLTGPQAHYGKDFQNGVQLAVEEVNASKPTIGGKEVKFVLLAEDDQADPRSGTVVAQRLVDDNIAGMLGHFNSGTTIPASKIYARAGIPQIAMATAPAYTEQGFKTTFRMMTSDTQQGSVVGSYAVGKLGFKKIAVIDDRTAYGQGLANEFEKAAKAAGATIVAREFTTDKSVDFRAILTKLKAQAPQAIFYGGSEVQAAPMARQIKELGISATLISGEMVKSDNFIKLAGDAAEGVIASLAGLPIEQMPGGAAYVAKYEKRFGAKVETYSPYAYDGAMAMFMAMKKADSVDPAKYLPALAATQLQGVTTSRLGYDAKGDLKEGGITVYKVVKGKWEAMESIGGK
ncbi:branched-chain amino acid ABC transporter substrate-binding protein [Niveibacterium microcysteis]|uniref:Branched-chain amino acid ABC transporter substrate-binding protein n=2 Tax=Rhodocyclaceae TaxID=75787 RepID=A0ABX7MC54_9RHOO|nr:MULTISPECIES: branched-chain amino acid ABC transporter substrate-binding protein [Niveibacterium]QSI79329.1 branched-chain amino acid ABC transporter substrate-binding protein [Niveibacterium microcysteis]